MKWRIRGKSGINIAELKGCPLRATAITYDPHGWVSDLTCVTVSGTGSASSMTQSVERVAHVLMICHDVMCFIFQSQGQLPF